MAQFSMKITRQPGSLLGGNQQLEVSTREFPGNFALFQVTDLIAERAVSLRRAHRLKLLDAIIWATGDVNSLPLVTRNTKDFPATAQGIRIPYVLQTSWCLAGTGLPIRA